MFPYATCCTNGNMKVTVKIFYAITSVACLMAVSAYSSVEAIPQEDSLDYAVQLFDSGEFIQAASYFEKFLARDPQNSMLNYYYGVCLAEQGIFTDETNQYLLKAVSGNTPDKIFYYVGMYFQSQELWNSAIKYYNRFKNYGTDEEKESVNVEERIQYCTDQVNAPPGDSLRGSSFSETVQHSEDTPVDHPAESNFSEEAEDTPVHHSVESNLSEESEDTPVDHSVESNPSEEEEAVTEAGEPSFERIHFQVSSAIAYLFPEHFRRPRALEFFREGQEAGERLRRSMAASDSLRALYSSTPTLREALTQKILSLEQESLSLKEQVDQAYAEARRLEQAYWDSVGVEETVLFTQEIRSLKQQLDEKKAVRVEPPEEDIPVELPPPEKPRKTRETEKQKTAEIVFKIQIGAYSRSLPEYIDRLYKKLSLIRDIDSYTDDRGVTVYTTGNLTTFEDAVQMQEQVRQEGVKDAFVVAYRDGKRITINEAKEILNSK